MISKKEQIWRYVLEEALGEKKRFEFEQKDIASRFGISTSTVFNALKIPRASGAITVSGRGFFLKNIEKLLTIWATQRLFSKDIVYQTTVVLSVSEIEKEMPGGIVYAAYSAYKFRFHKSPADYDRVIVYATEPYLSVIRQRFPHVKSSRPNLLVLESDPFLSLYGDLEPVSQLYVNLWNQPDWYAQDFLKALKERLELL